MPLNDKENPHGTVTHIAIAKCRHASHRQLKTHSVQSLILPLLTTVMPFIVKGNLFAYCPDYTAFSQL